jgi:hypothetical protein
MENPYDLDSEFVFDPSPNPAESLLAACLETEILAEERQHIILKPNGHRAGVRAVKHLEAVRDSIFI